MIFYRQILTTLDALNLQADYYLKVMAINSDFLLSGCFTASRKMKCGVLVMCKKPNFLSFCAACGNCLFLAAPVPENHKYNRQNSVKWTEMLASFKVPDCGECRSMKTGFILVDLLRRDKAGAFRICAETTFLVIVIIKVS